MFFRFHLIWKKTQKNAPVDWCNQTLKKSYSKAIHKPVIYYVSWIYASKLENRQQSSLRTPQDESNRSCSRSKRFEASGCFFLEKVFIGFGRILNNQFLTEHNYLFAGSLSLNQENQEKNKHHRSESFFIMTMQASADLFQQSII